MSKALENSGSKPGASLSTTSTSGRDAVSENARDATLRGRVDALMKENRLLGRLLQDLQVDTAAEATSGLRRGIARCTR